ncbi:MAG: outer membrane beta-barrel protein [Ignavibacteria bacterium]|nr:porin family protein [Ignavibacteria bacterium]MCC7158941.1 outer membrane beta-barrel protein [Ignavibacteria bacterium]
MKKLVALLIILAACFSLNNNSTFSQPQIKVHVTGGYDLPLPDLKGTYPTDTNSALQKSGFNIGADVKYYLGKKRNVGITLGGSYNAFSSGDISVTGGKFVTKVNILAVALGVEYNFMPKGKTQPFLGLEFTGNFFSGKYTTTPTSGTGTEATMKSASRFGIQFGGGVDFKLSKSVGAVLGVKYNLANLIGKDSTNSTVANEYTLNDKETTGKKSLNLSYIQVYAGVSFFFNEPKKTVKK